VSEPSSRLDRRSVLEGAAYAGVISGAAGLLQVAVKSEALQGLLLIVILLGFLFGGFVAGRGHFDSAARHGAAAAALAFVVIQGVALVRRLVVGDSVNVGSIILGALTAAVCGTLGGLLALRSPGPDAVRRGRRRGDLP
jgi:hypothetical protein